MWHLLTHIGNFWIIPKENGDCLLGVDDCDLGWYSDLHAARISVVSQETGCYSWDIQLINRDQHLESWAVGEPQSWLVHTARFP